MRRIAASLAAIFAAAAILVILGCGDGAEPDAPAGGGGANADAVPLSLILDFQPNAVHSGIYEAVADGALADRGVDLQVRAPGASTDAPKLLRAGRADLAILDIHDLAIAREQGIDLVGVGAIVQRPLAAVIAADGNAVKTPADLAGKRIGVTGLPSDDAVLDSVLAAGGLEPGDVDTVTIGFNAVPDLLAGKIDAATAFWNAEGVTLGRRLPTREFRVDRFGAPRYPELVLATTPEELQKNGDAIRAAVAGIGAGYDAVEADPEKGLNALLDAVPELNRDEQKQQLDAVLPAFGQTRALDRNVLEDWAKWEARHGIVDTPPNVGETFDFSVAGSG